MTAARRAGLPVEARAAVPRDCPPTVVDTLERCLAPLPEQRYASAAELARELDLCLQPRAHALLHIRRAGGSIIKRHPVAATLLLGMVPNIVMCILNIAYNWVEIVGRLSPADQRVFGYQLLAINVVAYTIGLGYVLRTRWGAFTALARLARGDRVEPPPSIDVVRRTLTLGLATAGVTAALWATSGLVFPTWMQFGAGSLSSLSGQHYLHFVVSNLLCGMISATQSYYVVTFLAVRYDYPWLLRARTADARDIGELARMARLGRLFLGLTVAVPFVALAAVLIVGDSGKAVIGFLAAIGFLGCAIAYVLDLAIRADLAALAAAFNPGGDNLGGGDSIDSFMSGSRR